MSCRPPCCKRDPERQCPICFTDQTWDQPIPPTAIEFTQNYRDLLKDGAGDASVGTCGTGVGGRDGSNGYDSHSYAHYLITQNTTNQKGSVLNNNNIATEIGDSLPRPADWMDTWICNQVIGERIYSVVNFKNNTPTDIAAKFTKTLPQVYSPVLKGQFYIPSAPILAGTYSKTYQVRTGSDRAGDILNWDKTLSSDFNPIVRNNSLTDVGIVNLARYGFEFAGQSWLQIVGGPISGETEVSNGDNVTNDDYALLAINDRRIFLKIFDEPQIYDTGLKFRDYLDGGLLFRIDVVQTAVNDFGSTISIECEVTYSLPESGFEVTVARTGVQYQRCQNGFATVEAIGVKKPAYRRPITGPLAATALWLQEPGWRLGTHDPSWWVNYLNEDAPDSDREYMFAFPWINEFKIVGTDFSDDPAFRVARFEHTDSSGNRKLLVLPSDYDDVTIPNGTTIDVGVVETGDLFKLGLDNEGEQTTEATITFDNPFITAVDDSSPTLSPYEYQTVTFTGAELVADGDADIVITHDQAGNLIPSPYTLTLSGDAPGGPDPTPI